MVVVWQVKVLVAELSLIVAVVVPEGVVVVTAEELAEAVVPVVEVVAAALVLADVVDVPVVDVAEPVLAGFVDTT
ncbi:MAG: hypothetical protein OK438_01420 [Thaumarchaeota archaeon]|nr:hypothetical protein [Nitrososphaerota archaeon]